MENKINVAELLKDCPKGMELDCTMYDNARFEQVDEKAVYPIVINIGEKNTISLTKEGHWNKFPNAKCVIFPKGKTTWEGFHRPFKNGDILTSDKFPFIYKNSDTTGIVKSYCGIDTKGNFWKASNRWTTLDEVTFATEEQKEKLFKAIKDKGYHWNPETKTLVKLPKFKDGDIIFSQYYDLKYVAIVKKIDESNDVHVYCLHGFTDAVFAVDEILGKLEESIEIRLATEKEKQVLFDAIMTNGYRWNVRSKTLEKLFPYKIGTKVWVKSDKEHKYIHTIVGISRNSFGNLEYEVKEEKTGVVVHYPESLLIPITTNEYKFKTGDRIKHKSSGLCCTLREYSEGISAYRTNIGLALTSKELEEWELAPNKFDISKLKPFDQVLVRDFDNETWEIDFFSRLLDGKHFKCHGASYVQCIPYKGNEHLHNSTDACNDYFKTWEE